MVDDRVVWVLGAGFSAGLGAPLLTTLFTEASEGDVRVRYRRITKLHDETARQVRWLYAYGSGREVFSRKQGTLTGERLWANAEDFVEYLDTAAEPDDGRPRPHRDRLNELISAHHDDALIGVDELRESARRLIAAECSSFLEGADVRREKWRPFRRWARMLGPNDTVVSFNYDRVLETLRDEQNKDAGNDPALRSALRVILPAATFDPGALQGCCPVLKLHGSVDWSKDLSNGKPNGNVRLFPDGALMGDAKFMAIATPGPSKMREAEGFDGLWTAARDALKAARVIVFMGFRFPETDAYARETLLEAIGENGTDVPESTATQLDLHVVLGNSPRDAERLASLLRFSCRKRDEAPSETARRKAYARPHRFTVTTHPLYAQDFLAVADRDSLFV
jgi:hypothetical protein